MKGRFSTKVGVTQVVKIENDGVFSHGDPDPTQLEVSVLDKEGDLHVIVFERQALKQLGGIVLGLAKAFPGVFGQGDP